MIVRSRQSFMLAMAVIFCSVGLSTTRDSAEQFACYHGSIESNNRGQLPLDSEHRLTSIPCGPPMTPTSTASGPTVAVSTAKPTPDGSAQPSPPDPTTAQPSTPTQGPSRRRRDIPGFMCAVTKTFLDGSKLTLDTTWTANFTCTPDGGCTDNMFCCKGANCNSVLFFQRASNTHYATVSTCLVGNKNSTVSQVMTPNCQGASNFCYNSTANGATKFGCSKMNSSCANITSEKASQCAEVGNSTLCCCASDNCNGPVPVSPTYPTRIVPTTATPYLVTASKTSSHWMLVLFIAAGVLIGGLVGAVVLVLCKRWKKKRVSGPLNISYSRVSADFANEDDDNIFSY